MTAGRWPRWGRPCGHTLLAPGVRRGAGHPGAWFSGGAALKCTPALTGTSDRTPLRALRAWHRLAQCRPPSAHPGPSGRLVLLLLPPTHSLPPAPRHSGPPGSDGHDEGNSCRPGQKWGGTGSRITEAPRLLRSCLGGPSRGAGPLVSGLARLAASSPTPGPTGHWPGGGRGWSLSR